MCDCVVAQNYLNTQSLHFSKVSDTNTFLDTKIDNTITTEEVVPKKSKKLDKEQSIHSKFPPINRLTCSCIIKSKDLSRFKSKISGIFLIFNDQPLPKKKQNEYKIILTE